MSDRAILPVVMALLAAGAGTPADAADRPTPAVEVVVRFEAARRVPDRRLADLERAVRVRLAGSRCGLSPRDPAPATEAGGTAAPPPADLVVLVRVDAWREIREPGGRTVFDTRTGRERAGWTIFNEIRYHLTIRARGLDKPLHDRNGRASARVGTLPVATFDPSRESRKRVIATFLRDLENRLCRAARSVRRSVR